MEENYKSLFRKVKSFVFDVDGVFTDGSILLSEDGSMLRTMSVRDGYAVQKAVKEGYQIVIITGGSSQAVKTRFEKLGVTEVHIGIQDKVSVLDELIQNNTISAESTLYMGDDLPDFEAIQKVFFPCCPSDAFPEIKSLCKYISNSKGGKGCVRDVIEQTLKVQGNW